MTQPTMGDGALPQVGDVLDGKYRIESLIGKGGMGAVFAAHDEFLAQRVAVKFLLGDIVGSPEAVSRFLTEGRAASRIQSEHVARVFTMGKSPSGLPYMVMEFLDGLDLSQLVEQRGALAVEDAVGYVLEALEALAQAHAQGIVHRDLKPANLFLCRRQDGGSIVKVLDFGISKASNPFGQAGYYNLTSTKSMLGSPLYMSPEQLRSAKNVDARTDIWSLGVILFELLTGTVPFNGDTLGELFISILESPTPQVSQRRPDVPQALDAVLMRCLDRRVDARYANVAELATALAPFAAARHAVCVERVCGALGIAPNSIVLPAAPPRPMQPSFNAITGPGMPQTPIAPNASTQNAWGGNTGSGVMAAPAPPKTNTGAIVGAAVGALLLLGVTGGGLAFYMRSKSAAAQPPSDPTPTATAAATTPATTAPVPPPPPTVEPPQGPAGPATAATAGPAHAATAHTGKPGTKPTPAASTAAATAPPPPPTTAAAPPPPPPTAAAKPFDPFATGRK